jgi:predicted lactoylglutathione lyase
MQVEDIRAFVPSKDFEQSKLFYQTLGFEMTFESDALAEFENGECSFLLQHFYNEEFANNLMLQLVVNSVEDVHVHLQQSRDIFPRFKAPEDVPWGKVLYLWGPSGELWHITEFL